MSKGGKEPSGGDGWRRRRMKIDGIVPSLPEKEKAPHQVQVYLSGEMLFFTRN